MTRSSLKSYKSFSDAFFSRAYARPLFVDTRAHVMGVHFQARRRVSLLWAFLQMKSLIGTNVLSR
jgi:hypothetical protein